MASSESIPASNVVSTQKSNAPVVPRPYSKVIITLENCLLSKEKLTETPSQKDGVSSEDEIDLRIIGCEYIQHSGLLLRLPQVAMATGQVLFQRFYFSKSFVKQSMEVVAMACICLASKIEESPRRLRDVCNVFHHIKQVLGEKTITPLALDQDYISLKNQVIKAERRVLKELGFCVHVKHPHKTIVTMLQLLDSSENQDLMQRSWNYMNDSLRTEVFMRYTPETIACACIYLSARELTISLPSKPAWYLLFDAKEDDIKVICRKLLHLYQREKPNLEKLEKMIGDIKAEQQVIKLKLKGLSGSATPTTTQEFSPVSRSRQGSPKANNASEKKDQKTEPNLNGNGLNLKETSNHAPSKVDTSRSTSSRESSKERKDRSRSSSLTPRKRKKYDISPPRSYKEHRHHHHHSRQRKSRSRSREKKENRHKMEKKRHRSRSISISPPYKKSKEYRNSRKSRSPRSYSRSPVRHEKSRRTSRKDRSRDRRRSHSRERSRR